MMNVKVKADVEKDNIQDDWMLWRNFSKEEIKEFSYVTGDTNSIHLTENPVVQGLFILKELCESTKAKKTRSEIHSSGLWRQPSLFKT